MLPALLLLTLGIMDIGRLLWTHTTLNRAVAAAARCGSVDAIKCGTPSLIQSYAVSQAWGLTIAASAFTVTTPACGVQVQAAYDFAFVIPWFSVAAPFGAENTIALKATACYAT